MPEDDPRFQEARIALLDYFGDHLRFWGTNVLALAIAFFAAMQVHDFLSSKGIFVLVLVVLLMEGVFALVRAIFHGRMARSAIEVQPAEHTVGPLVFRLHEAARGMAGDGTGVFVAWSGNLPAWLIWTIFSLIVGLLANYWLGPVY